MHTPLTVQPCNCDNLEALLGASSICATLPIEPPPRALEGKQKNGGVQQLCILPSDAGPSLSNIYQYQKPVHATLTCLHLRFVV